MSKLGAWKNRSAEEAYLFNPAYCGGLIYEFVKEYGAAKKTSVPYALVFCALPVSLHPHTRQRLPHSTVTSLYDWINSNQDLLINYHIRAKNLVPYAKEAIGFLISREALKVDKYGNLEVGEKKANFTPKFLNEATAEMEATIKATRMVARWFAKAGSVSSILAGWGIKP